MPWEDLEEELPPLGGKTQEFDPPEGAMFVVNLKGLNTLIPGRMMPDGAAVTADHVWIRDGLLRRSLGAQQLGDAPWQAGTLTKPLLLTMFRKHNSDGTSTKRWVCIVGGAGATSGVFYEYDGSVWQSRATGLTTDPYTAAQYQNRLYITNGTDRKHWDGTTLSTWTLGAFTGQPPIFVHRSEEGFADGYLVTGTYKAVYTFFCSATGEETLASPVLTRAFVGAGGDNKWFVDISTPHLVDQRFDQIKSYRSKLNASDLLYEWTSSRWYDSSTAASTNAFFGTSVSAGDEVSVGGDIGKVADSNLTVAPPTSLTAGDPPKGRGVAVYDDRLWMFGIDAAPSTLAFSVRGQPNNFPPLNTVIVDQYDGFGFTGAKVFDGRFYAWCQQTAYLIGIDEVTQYSSRRLETGFGLSHHNAVVEADNSLWGVGYGVFWRSDGQGFVEISYPWSERMKILSTGASWFYPVHLAFDPAADRRRLLMCSQSRSGVAQNAAMIDLSSDFVDWNDKNEIIATGERSNGTPWVVSLSKNDAGAVLAKEWFADSAAANIYETTPGIYETRDVDPDPQVVDKFFVAFDMLFARPPTGKDGRFEWAVYYDSCDDAEEEGDVPAFEETRKTSRFIRELLKIHDARQTIRFKFTMPTGYPTLLALRFWWKPYGDKTRQ